MHEARRLAREQAEKRKVQTQQSAGSGQRLGGTRPRPGEDIRRVIIEAVERRNKTLKGCGVKDKGDEGLDEQEIRRIEEQATRNGFRSKAEEDEANEAAIAQALWELVQEDEKERFGEGYVEPSRKFPAGSQGAILQHEEKNSKGSAGPSSSSSKQPPPIPYHSKPPTTVSSRPPPPPPSIPEEPSNEHSTDGWACRICTLYNPDTFIFCDACGTKRPPRTLTIDNSPPIPTSSKKNGSSSNSKSSSSTSKRPSSSVIDLTKSPPSIRTRPSSSHSSKHSSPHRFLSSHGSSSKSQSKSTSNSHSHSQSRISHTALSSRLELRSEPSRSETRPEPRSELSNSTSLKGLNNNLKREQKEKEKSKAKALLQAQAEADAARLRLLTEKWQCSFCGKRMEKQWWTCSICGRMKDSSG